MNSTIQQLLNIDKHKLENDFYYKNQQIDIFIKYLSYISVEEFENLKENPRFSDNINDNFLVVSLLGIIDIPVMFESLLNYILKKNCKENINFFMILNALNESNFNKFINLISSNIEKDLKIEEKSLYPQRGYLLFTDDNFLLPYPEKLRQHYSYKPYIYIHRQPSKINYFLEKMCFSQIKNMLFERFWRKDFESITHIANSQHLTKLFEDEDIQTYFKKESDGSKIENIFNKLILHHRVSINIKSKNNSKLIMKL